MTPILSLWRVALRRLVTLWWRWALHEIDPMHPDVPLIVHRLNELRSMR